MTPSLSFGHNLCCKYPNGSCKPILNIYIPKASNDINNFSTQWIWPLQSPSKKRDSNSQSGSSLGSVGGSFLHTLLHSQKHEMWFPGSLLGRTFVSPCLGHEPKARVATKNQNGLISTIYMMTFDQRKIWYLALGINFDENLIFI